MSNTLASKPVLLGELLGFERQAFAIAAFGRVENGQRRARLGDGERLGCSALGRFEAREEPR